MTNSETAPNRTNGALRPGTELDLLFTDLLASGQAVGRAGGLVVFCFGPLPHEHARVRITLVKPSYAVAEPIALGEASPERAQPFCSVFGICGGCQVQHLAYPAQLRWKREMLRNALARIGGIADGRVRDVIGMADPRAYRNKIALVVERRESGAVVGFYRQRSHDLVPLDGCPVVVPQLDAYIGILAAAAPDSPTARALGQARHFVARHLQATGEAIVSVTTERPSEAVATAAPDLLRRLPGAVGIVNSFEPASRNAVLGRHRRLLAGEACIEECIAALRYRVSDASFFQVNTEIVARIFETIESELPAARKVVDLYCGMGTFSLLFARRGALVEGVEENAHAVAEAQANATLNELQGSVHFCARTVEAYVRSARGRERLASADLVFLDPPRKGSDETTLRAIVDSGAPRVSYLSCDPATLARDLKFLTAKGYRLTTVQPFDMFPQTGHVEALAILERGNDVGGH